MAEPASPLIAFSDHVALLVERASSERGPWVIEKRGLEMSLRLIFEQAE
jgi:hypothetical protein